MLQRILFFLPLLVFTPPAHADSYLFDFHVNPISDFSGDIVYTSDTLLPTTLTYVRGDVGGYAPPTLLNMLIYGDYYDFGTNPNPLPPGAPRNRYLDFFVLSPESVGTHPISTIELEPFIQATSGTLTVTQVTPEPESWGLMATGLLGGFSVLRRRLWRRL